MFKAIYNKVMVWSKHKYSQYYLYSVSFAESSFFPLPPDIMLIPIALANRAKTWHYAFWTTVFSVLGGLLGYLIGYLAYDAFLNKLIAYLGYTNQYAQLEHWFDMWGVWLVFVAGFSPIPYKLFTIGSGSLHLNVLLFTLASIISRGLRFYLVCGAIALWGEKIESVLHRRITLIGWLVVLIFLIIYSFYFILLKS